MEDDEQKMMVETNDLLMCLLNGDSVMAVLSAKAGGSWSGIWISERIKDVGFYNLSTRPW